MSIDPRSHGPWSRTAAGAKTTVLKAEKIGFRGSDCNARPARLVDGADDLRKMVLNRFLGTYGNDLWRWNADDRAKI